MSRTLFLLLVPLALHAQLQVSLYDGTERPLTGLVQLGGVAMGDTAEFRFRARNTSNAGVALQTMSVSGQGFTFSSRPTLPYIVAPGNFAEFRVVFAPLGPGSFSASLAVNGASWLLYATGTAAPVLSVEGGPAQIVAAGAPIDFGRVQKKRWSARLVRLSNGTEAALRIGGVSVDGSAFRMPVPPAIPVDLAPGAAIEFEVTFSPLTQGQHTGSLVVDGRKFVLKGVAFDPPLPEPAIVVADSAVSGSQPVVSVRFNETPETSGTGVLLLDFRPTVPNASDDPAVMFVGSGSRRLSFQVTEGDAAASFGAAKNVLFQTGTTAGILTFTLQCGEHTIQRTLTIAPAKVAVDAARANRRASDLDVTITGYDNTRTAGRFTFTFFDRSGATVQPGAIPVDLTGDFSRYFAISRVGGAFHVRATFPVTGDASQIGGVEVSLANSAGAAATGRVEVK